MAEITAEYRRLEAHARREADWRRWGPYLSERAWGTVREDYSADGSAWTYFPHDHARSKAYRWGEDGLAGISDREGRLCFALAAVCLRGNPGQEALRRRTHGRNHRRVPPVRRARAPGG